MTEMKALGRWDGLEGFGIKIEDKEECWLIFGNVQHLPTGL